MSLHLYWASMSNTCWARCMLLPLWILYFRPDLVLPRLRCKNALKSLDKLLDFKKSPVRRGLAWIGSNSPYQDFQDSSASCFVNTEVWVTKSCLNEFSRRTHFSIVCNGFLVSEMFSVSFTYRLYPYSSEIEPNNVYPRDNVDKWIQILCIYPGVRAN